jgi:hypothetical protein
MLRYELRDLLFRFCWPDAPVPLGVPRFHNLAIVRKRYPAVVMPKLQRDGQQKLGFFCVILLLGLLLPGDLAESSLVADGGGFEPPVPFGTHAFQACKIDRSVTHPLERPQL